MKKEREYKFYNVANQQFKFAAIDRHGIFENKVRTVCSWLGIACKQPLLQEIRDEYYDDKHFSLKEAGYSLRLRQENSIFRYTLKRRAVESKSSNPVKRDEHEEPITRAGFKKIVNSTTGVMDLIKTNFGQVVKCAACDLILTVKNDRTTLPIVTKRERYSLTYDIFYFLYGRRFSEVLLEVEIESKRPNPPKDAQIDRLREAFEVLFNYQPNSESKLERGVDWIDDPDGGVITIYTLMMDIVGYSKETAGSQKQMVQTLSKVTRDVILKNRYNYDDVKHIPTGDGMILVFEKHPERLVRIAFEIQDKLAEYAVANSKKIEIRTGLHSGPIFKYTDVNGNQNFAGGGINIAQRVMSLGDAGHILASEEAHNCMGDIDDYSKSLFKYMGKRTIKHGREITIYNVFDEAARHGNSVDPTE